jgi:hypothetical protein
VGRAIPSGSQCTSSVGRALPSGRKYTLHRCAGNYLPDSSGALYRYSRHCLWERHFIFYIYALNCFFALSSQEERKKMQPAAHTPLLPRALHWAVMTPCGGSPQPALVTCFPSVLPRKSTLTLVALKTNDKIKIRKMQQYKKKPKGK